MDNAVPTSTRINVGEVELSVIDTGPGPSSTVILLHGWPDRALMWRHQIAALSAAGHRVIAPDLRGFGDSDKPEGTENYQMHHLIGDVLGLMDALEVPTAKLAGHDWGSALGWLIPTVAPQRIEKYAALSVGHPRAFQDAGLAQKARSWYMLYFQFPGVAEKSLAAKDWWFFKQFAHAGWGGDTDTSDMVDRQIADLERPGALTASLNWYRANINVDTFINPDEAANFPNVQCPVLGIWSSNDGALTERQMTDSQRFVDGDWQYHRIEGASHWIAEERPDEVNQLLVDFFA